MQVREATPWLASVFVEEHSRKRGVGPTLIAAAITEASGLGFERVFLWCEGTKLTQYYAANGFKKLRDVVYVGKEITVMTAYCSKSR